MVNEKLQLVSKGNEYCMYRSEVPKKTELLRPQRLLYGKYN